MKINAIAAIGKQNQMALNNELPWHYPEDLEIFKTKVNNKIVIMGRKTYESMPKSFFKKVTPIIISTTLEANLHLADSLDDALALAEDMGEDEVWICGGVSIYEEALERKLINHLYISHIPYKGEADRYFPGFTDMIMKVIHEEIIQSPSNNTSFKYKVYMLETENSLLTEFGIRNNLYDYGNPFASPFQRQAGTGLLGGLDMSDARNSILPDRLAAQPLVYRQNNATSISLDTETFHAPIVVQTSIPSPTEKLRDIIYEVCEQYEDVEITTALAYDCQNEIARAINRKDQNSSTMISVDLEMEAISRPMYTLGGNMPIEHSFDYGNNFFDIKVRGTFLGQLLDITERILIRG
ncbi:MAG: dihydrofolate reductase [Lachnospiraceae bacterium]|nr:dihydrofolate reductase [Lachnospiraceae bacterium]